jgi:hypothetical protein
VTTATTAAKPARRTQADRRAPTRSALLAAAARPFPPRVLQPGLGASGGRGQVTHEVPCTTCSPAKRTSHWQWWKGEQQVAFGAEPLGDGRCSDTCFSGDVSKGQPRGPDPRDSPVREFGVDLLGHGGEQAGLVAELVVESTACHPAARTISSVAAMVPGSPSHQHGQLCPVPGQATLRVRSGVAPYNLSTVRPGQLMLLFSWRNYQGTQKPPQGRSRTSGRGPAFRAGPGTGRPRTSP